VATEAGLPTQKYHVALSFAGEDRAYVEKVATCLKAEGVSVYYDRFEECSDGSRPLRCSGNRAFAAWSESAGCSRWRHRLTTW